MNKYLDNLKHIFSGKRKTENLIVLLVLLVVLLFAANYILNDDKDKAKAVSNANYMSDNVSSSDIESKLASILEEIEGLSNVSVMISYSNTSKVIPIYDIDENTVTNSDGSSKTTINKTVLYEENEGDKVVAVESTELATPSGAIVVATGVNVSDNILKIKEAVSTITGLATHKVSVFEK